MESALWKQAERRGPRIWVKRPAMWASNQAPGSGRLNCDTDNYLIDESERGPEGLEGRLALGE